MIDKETLKNLYLKKDYSMEKISKILKVSKNKVRYWLIKHKIPIKKIGRKRGIEIPFEELEYLYLIKKLSCAKIAKKYGCSTSKIYLLLKKFSIPRRSHFRPL